MDNLHGGTTEACAQQLREGPHLKTKQLKTLNYSKNWIVDFASIWFDNGTGSDTFKRNETIPKHSRYTWHLGFVAMPTPFAKQAVLLSIATGSDRKERGEDRMGWRAMAGRGRQA